MQQGGYVPIVVCTHDDPGLTLTYFMARSNLAPYSFVREEVKTVDFSSPEPKAQGELL